MTVFLAHGVFYIRGVISAFWKTTDSKLLEHHVLFLLVAIPLEFSLSLLSEDNASVDVGWRTLRAIVTQRQKIEKARLFLFQRFHLPLDLPLPRDSFLLVIFTRSNNHLGIVSFESTVHLAQDLLRVFPLLLKVHLELFVFSLSLCEFSQNGLRINMSNRSGPSLILENVLESSFHVFVHF